MVRRLVLGFALFSLTAVAQDDVLVERPKDTTPAPYGFLQYLPPGYSQMDGRGAPLVVFLHGHGELGPGTVPILWDDMTANGPARLLKTGATVTTLDGGVREARGGSRIFANANAVVLVPQSLYWWNPALINTFITWAVRNYKIDQRRVYVTGISMGGGGTWDYVSAEGRGRVAAVIPICGASSPGSGAAFLKTPVWLFHAWGDGTVNRQQSINWSNAIADARAGVNLPDVLTGYPHVGGNVNSAAATTMTGLYRDGGFDWVSGAVPDGGSPLRFTMYTDGSHDSWTRTYANAQAWEWLFRHRSVVHPDFEDAVVVDDLDEGFSGGGWTRVQPAGGGFYGWETLEAQVSSSPLAIFEGEVPSAGVYRLSASCVGGSNRTVARVVVNSGAGQSTFSWDQRDGGVARLGEAAVSGAFVVTVTSTASSGVLSADAIALGFVRPIDGGVVPDAGVVTPDAGVVTPDSGVVTPDSGVVTPDSGIVIPDSGIVEPDAGVIEPDAGVIETDAGLVESDGGVELPPASEPVVGGCGCSSGPLSVFGLLGLLFLRRRPTRPSP